MPNPKTPAPMELLPPRYDYLFKSIIAAGWANKGDGDVEAPSGYFALVTVEANEVAELSDAVAIASDGPSVPVGYFTTIEDSSGVIVVYRWATENQAKDEYARHERQYEEWVESNGN